MIEGVLMLVSQGFYGGAVGEMFSSWQQAGFFSYLLPFLLIFALVFGILSKMDIFSNNKAVNGIIALVIGFMSLQFELVPRFFSEIFPRLGVGLAIILIILILLGLFLDPGKSAINYTLLGVGAVIVIVILIQTAGAVGWSSGYWWSQNWPMVAGAIFILVLVGIIVGSSSPSSKDTNNSLFARALLGNNN
jgi:hypothetical protein